MPAPPLTPTQWLDTSAATKALACSASTLRQLREAGVLRAGEHFRRVGAAGKGGLRWDVIACEQTLRDHAAAQEAHR